MSPEAGEGPPPLPPTAASSVQIVDPIIEQERNRLQNQQNIRRSFEGGESADSPEDDMKWVHEIIKEEVHR